MKRILSTLLCVIILTNFIFANYSYAEEAESTSTTVEGMPEIASDEMEYGENIINDLTYEGSVNSPQTGNTENFDIFSSFSGPIDVVLGIVCMILNVVPLTVELALTFVTMDGSEIGDSISSASNSVSFSIQKTVFNEIGLFNIDYFDFSDTYEVGENTVYIPSAIIDIKESVASWFYICRIIAMVIGLGVLIYVGIRMAISTVASDKAVYKKMLISWVESMVLLFLMHYIIQAIMGLGSVFSDLCYNLRVSLEAEGSKSFEQELLNTIALRLFTSTGGGLMVSTVMIWCLAFAHLKFFIMYLKRTLMVGFLIVIAPLITITYPMDKMGDNKAQAFSAWLNELLINVFIQPIHAIIYLVFSFTAGEIASFAPLLALIFLMSITSAEKMVRNIFNMQNSKSLDNLKDLARPGKKGGH